MAVYLMLTTLTDEGRKTIKANPARIKEVNKEVEAMGAKVLAQYAVLGPYDFVNILEAPNNEAVVRVAIELGARGTLGTLTMAALTVDEFVKSLKGSTRQPSPGAKKPRA
jgi:uncharacterized protein with GYD domain